MNFIVHADVFAKLPTVCFGVVVAKNLDNRTIRPAVADLLHGSIAATEQRFNNSRAREDAGILPYREAFTQLGMNPNKFMSSIEAMASRIEKKKGFPQINPVVDLGNAVSLKYLVPLGAHDTDSAAGDIQVRFSQAGDRFIPFGELAAELLEAGELIYSVGDRVKTRRWIWRQSEEGKVTEDSRNVFFPLDGFSDSNQAAVIAARDELATLLERHFGCEVATGFVDRGQPAMEF
ncbi:MAG TPA: phenylalanine--tRNA ligase beta subunit-related protein [Patescibacteria group bacterium]|nr:phenylalanine--tRNA ligase beta subunit-related protein [Patescibacteria group bacterium]